MKTIFLTISLFCLTVTIMAQDATHLLNEHLAKIQEDSALTMQDLTYVISSEHISNLSGVQHIYYNQTINGLRILGTESSLHISKNNSLLKNNNNFIPKISNLQQLSNTPSLSVIDAVNKVALKFNYDVKSSFIILDEDKVANKFTLSDGGISLSPIPVELVYVVKKDGTISLAWDISIEEIAQEHWYSLRIDAKNGQIINMDDWVVSCTINHEHSDDKVVLNYNSNLYDIPDHNSTSKENYTVCDECYEVFALPLESPYYGLRTIENIVSSNASPFGWHDTDGVSGAEFTVTRGNNVNAYEDGNNPGFQPDGGTNLDFSGYPFSQNYTEENPFEEAAITNLFYWTNVIHDVLDAYGFDAASGNFQENNYGNGGIENDSVNAEAQDGSSTCNANFSTPPDGEKPRMQMFICGDKDGDFDNLTIAHEYAHGVSNRLTGGAAVVGCVGGDERMGEGWSDYIGLMLTMDVDDFPEEPRGVLTYLLGQGPNTEGARTHPYSTDFATNPHTYDDIKTEAVPHGVGSVWAVMLWDMTWDLIDDYGFSSDIYDVTGNINQDAGNVIALALVIEAMKLQPCDPGFVDGRDAILAADVAIYGGANECLIWEAFARRGLGVSAVQGFSASRDDGIEAFDTPSGLAIFSAPNDLCISIVELTGLTGGTPVGGSYSGPGVIDDGNGFSYSFNPIIAGIGEHTISYQVQDGNCSVASVATDNIIVSESPEAPITFGVNEFCVGDQVTVSAIPSGTNTVIRWYETEQQGNFLFEGDTYTYTPTETQTLYAEEGPMNLNSELKISEISIHFPDEFEVSNIGGGFDYTGYTMALSDQPLSDINTVNPIIYEFGYMEPNSVIHFTDEVDNPDYWGNNIWWIDTDSSWIIILDPDGNVIESVFWNITEAEIATLNININGIVITGSDVEWIGAGADFSDICEGSFRRNGENNTANNWSSDCLSSDYGVYNEDIGLLGFQGCFSSRVATEVVAETEVPTIICPEDMVITEAGGNFEMPDFTIDATATDNCSFTITQSPAIGSNLSAGNYTVTLTVTDEAGNTSMCEFQLDVVLGLDDAVLNTNISLVPNPTFGNIELTYNGDKSLTTLQVIDVNGRLIKNVIPSSTKVTNFSLAELADGFYFVRIIAGDSVIVKQVIKK